LIHHGAQQVRVNLTAGGDEAGADFDDHSHECRLSGFSENGIALGPAEGSPLLLHLSHSFSKSLGLAAQGAPAGKDNIPILQLKWLSGKRKTFLEALCLPPTPQAAFPIA
jgi:hypothetical protein